MQKVKSIFENFSEKFPILNKTYDLYQEAADISKSEENTLRKSSEITILEILELIVIATRQSKEDKKQTLRQALRKLDTLKVFANMAKELKAVSEAKYNTFIESSESVSKMVGGWLKAINATTSTSK